MIDPKKRRYAAMMLAGFGAIALSILLFFTLSNINKIGDGLNRLSAILAPFIYGGIVAYLLRRVCNAFEVTLQEFLPKKLKRFAPGLSVALSMTVALLLVYGLLDLILPQLASSISNLWSTLPGKFQNMMDWAIINFGENERLVQMFTSLTNNAYNELDTWFRQSIVPQFTNIVSGVGLSVWKLLLFVYNMIIGLIVAVYLLRGRKRFARQGVLVVRGLLPENWANMVLNEIAFVDRLFDGFIVGKIMDSAIVGVLCYIGCWLLKMPNALLVSAIVGITNVIPFFGPFIGAVPSTLLILIEDPMKALWFLLFVLFLQQLDGNIIGPKILGNRTGLSSFWVLFAIILFGGLWGVVGMVICVPLFAVIYDLIKRLVIRGLKNKEHIEVWDHYKSEYPDEQMPDGRPMAPSAENQFKSDKNDRSKS